MYLRITASGSMEKCTKDLIQIGFVTIAEQSKEQLVSDSFDHHVTSSSLNKDKRHHHPDVSCEDILLINTIIRGPESVKGKEKKKNKKKTCGEAQNPFPHPLTAPLRSARGKISAAVTT